MSNYAPYYSPNGHLIIGTVEILKGTALISGIDPENGQPNYEGGTVVNWDSKETVTRSGDLLFECENGARWTFNQLSPLDPALGLGA